MNKMIPLDYSQFCILFVDDDRNILQGIERALSDEPFQNVFAISPEAAMIILKNQKIHIIVSDLAMPDKDGLTFLKEVKDYYPEIIRIVLTGYAQVNQILASVNSGDIFRYILKPFKFSEEFIPSILQACDLYQLQENNRQLVQELADKQILLEKQLSEKDKLLNKGQNNLKRVMNVVFNIKQIIQQDCPPRFNAIREICQRIKDSEAQQEIQQLIDQLEHKMKYVDLLLDPARESAAP